MSGDTLLRNHFWEMSPAFAADDLAHGVASDAVAVRDLAMQLTASHARANVVDLRRIQLLETPRALPPFPNRVQVILLMGTEE